MSGDFPLPGTGLRSAVVVQLASGVPFNVTTGRDDNLDGVLSDRPDGVKRNQGKNSSLEAINALRAEANRTQAALQLPLLSPITSLEEPTFFQIDLRLYRSFLFSNGDRMKGQLFLQVFNLLDRENVGLIEGRAISPSFGEPIALAGPPRTLEFGLRVGY